MKLALLNFVLIFIQCSSVLLAQSYELKIDKIKDEKGLDPGATFAIAEDSVGFLWFGTVDGLYRYDGLNYKIFRHQNNNSNSLSWNTIRALCLTDDNKLWIGTQGGGLDCFDLLTEQFTHYPYQKGNPEGLSGSDIWSLYADSKNNVWVGVVGSGIDMLDRRTNSFRHFNVLPEKTVLHEDITIRAVYEDSKGLIWVGMVGQGLSAIDPKTGIVENFRNNPNDNKSLGSNDVYGIFEDHEKNLVICAYTGGLNFFNRETRSFTRYFMNINKNNNSINDLLISAIEKAPGQYWIGSEFGLSIFDKRQNRITNYQHEKETQNSLTDNRIRVVYKDSRGIVWVASEAGVDKFIEQKNFKIYKHKPGDDNTIPPGIVRSICEDNEGNIWVGIINEGLVKLNKTRDKITRFDHYPSSLQKLLGYYITSIFQDSEGILWCGDWDKGLFRFNKESGSFKLIASTYNTTLKLTDTRIQFIKEASPGILWIGTEYGLNWIDTKNNISKSFLHQIDNKNSLSGNSLQSNAFIQDEDGNLWIGSWSGGLDRIEFKNRDPETAVFKRFSANAYNSDSLNSNNVISLLMDKNYLWIGTFGGGLNRMDLKTNKVKHYTTEDGLANNIIFSILQDENNSLWLSTDRGISKFDPENETFKNYFKTDGLQDDHFFWGAAFKTKKGELFFGGINGMNSFSPAEIIKNAKPPFPVMLDIKLFEKSIDSETPISALKSLEVKHDNNYVSFEYAGLDFIEPERIQYMIKLEGLDQNWHLIGNRRFTSYSSLAPNEYLFRLKAANIDGIWNEKELNFRLVIKPPWWKTWYAISFAIILFLGSFLAFYFIRIRILKNQTQKLEEIVRKRTSVIMDQKQELQIVNKTLFDQKEELSQTLEELKNTQNQLIASEKMASLGILTAGVAHEINNPLNFIMGAYDVLEDYFASTGELKDERIPPLLNSIKTGVDRATEIVKGLSQFSRNNDTVSENCEINSIINNCLTMLNNHLKGRIDINKKISNEELIIKGNVGKLHQVFINILSNASQSIDKNGVITITTLKQDKLVYIDITDTGYGISRENLAKITDPFYTTKDPGKGTGLGLSIAYRIIQDHKGKIEFHSELQKGTSVKIWLPVSQE